MRSSISSASIRVGEQEHRVALFRHRQAVGAVFHAVRLPEHAARRRLDNADLYLDPTAPSVEVASPTTWRRPTLLAISTCSGKRSVTRSSPMPACPTGRILGQTYANMFPDNVRAVIIDGVLDPIAWTTGDRRRLNGPVLHSPAQRHGCAATLDEFFRLCDAGGANARWARQCGAIRRTRAALKIHPLPITFPDGSTGEVNYSILIGDDAGCDVRLVVVGVFAEGLAGLEGQAALPPWASASSSSGDRQMRTSRSAGSRTTRTSSRASRRCLRGLGQPALVLGLVDERSCRRRCFRLLRPSLDLGIVDLRRVAEERLGSLHGAVQPATRRIRC